MLQRVIVLVGLFSVGLVAQTTELDVFRRLESTISAIPEDSSVWSGEGRVFQTRFDHHLFARGRYRDRAFRIGYWRLQTEASLPLVDGKRDYGRLRAVLEEYHPSMGVQASDGTDDWRLGESRQSAQLGWSRRLFGELGIEVLGRLHLSENQEWADAAAGLTYGLHDRHVRASVERRTVREQAAFTYDGEDVVLPREYREDVISLSAASSGPFHVGLSASWANAEPFRISTGEYTSQPHFDRRDVRMNIGRQGEVVDFVVDSRWSDRRETSRYEKQDMKYGKLTVSDAEYRTLDAALVWPSRSRGQLRLTGGYQWGKGQLGAVVESWPFVESIESLLGAAYYGDAAGEMNLVHGGASLDVRGSSFRAQIGGRYLRVNASGDHSYRTSDGLFQTLDRGEWAGVFTKDAISAGLGLEIRYRDLVVGGRYHRLIPLPSRSGRGGFPDDLRVEDGGSWLSVELRMYW